MEEAVYKPASLTTLTPVWCAGIYRRGVSNANGRITSSGVTPP
jgi:hypothetical protein